MKKNLFKFTILSFIFLGIMILLMFIPLGDYGDFDNISVIYLSQTHVRALLPKVLNLGVLLYPIGVAVFTILIVLKGVKNIILSKNENDVLNYNANTKFLWILLILAIWGWINSFLLFGQGDGNFVAIGMATLAYLVPVIALMIVNKKLKKVTKK